jgi:hypothetical protein
MSLDVKCAKCGDGTCSGPLYMHGGCHMKSPTYEILFGDKLNFRCATCSRHIVTFLISDIVAGNEDLTRDIKDGSAEVVLDPICHPEAGTWGILHNNVDLVVQCAECNEPILKCKVLGLAPSGAA